MPSPPPHPDRAAVAAPRALIGWTHRDMPMGIELSIQSARSQVGLENEQIETQPVVMTRNQALLLGRYLLSVTGHDPEPARGIAGWLRRLVHR